jgi:hypothetical protein
MYSSTSLRRSGRTASCSNEKRDLLHPKLTVVRRWLGTLWWERGPNRLGRDPLFVTALLSDLLYFLSNEEPRYLAAFEVGRPNPKAYPINKLDDYERFYRGGDRSPHHTT